MLYTKPKNIRYVDMCIYIDNIVKRGDPTDKEIDLIFEYLYHLSFMLAHKHKYFNEFHYYEEFAIFFATEVLYRLFYNPKLKQIDENGEPILTPIKSVLNYMKSILYGRKCLFESKNYSQKIVNTDKNNFNSSFELHNKLRETLVYTMESDIDIYLKTVSSEIKKLVYSNCIYKNDKILLKNIYISCLLSVVNSFTFTKLDLDNISSTYILPESKYKYIDRLYKKNRDNCVILYNLDNSFYDYIKVMVRRIFTKLQKDISDLSKKDVDVSDETLSELVFLELDGKLTIN